MSAWWHWIEAISTSSPGFTGNGANNGYQHTKWLKLSNFGFTIPSTATNLRLRVRVQRRKQFFDGASGKYIKDRSLKLLKAGTAGGNEKADTTTDWPTSDTDKWYGSSSVAMATEWGNGPWVYSDVNASTFGVRFQVTTDIAWEFGGDPRVEAQIDLVEVELTYDADQTVSGGGGISSAESFGQPAITTLTVLPSGIAGGPILNDPLIVMHVSCAGAGSGEGVGAAQVQSAPQQVFVEAAIAGGESALGTPLLYALVLPSSVSDGEQVGTPELVDGGEERHARRHPTPQRRAVRRNGRHAAGRAVDRRRA